MTMKKILIADDEPDILEFLKYNLVREGFSVFTACNGIETIEKAKKINPDLVILDVMMPELDGIETCRRLRELNETKNTYIIFLSAKSEDYTQIIGLDIGADDYIVKPVRLRILISKIKAFFRRSDAGDSPNCIRLNNLVIDKDKYTITMYNQKITFPKKEFDLVFLLASKPGRVFARDEIYAQIWGSEIIVGDRTIDVYIRKIREKLGDDTIMTIKGVGYRFDIKPE